MLHRPTALFPRGQRPLAEKEEQEDLSCQPQLQRIASLREQLVHESAKVALEVRAILTPEQLARAAQVRDRMRQLHNEMRQLIQPGNS